MKKLMIALTLVASVFFGANQLQAEIPEPDYNIIQQDYFDFSAVNIFSDSWILESNNIEFPTGTEMVDIRFIKSEYHIQENDGGLDSEILFFDMNGVLITTIPFYQIRVGMIGGDRYLIPLERYNLEDAKAFRVQVAQDFSTVPGNYMQFINPGRVIYSDEVIISEFIPNLDLDFENYNFYGDINAQRSDLIEIPIGVVNAIFVLPETSYNLESSGGIDSQITFYDFQNNILSYLFLDDPIGGTYQPDVPSDAVYMQVRVMQSYDYTPSAYTSYFNRNSSLTYNEYKSASFYIHSELYQGQAFVKFVEPIDPPENLAAYGFVEGVDYTFNGWLYYDENGNLGIFNFNAPRTTDIELYASTTIVGSLGANFGEVTLPGASPPEDADALIHELLGSFGMNNPEGNVIFTVIILLFTNFVLLFTGIKGFALPIINIAILGLLFFGGFVPFWVMLILTIILGLMFVGMRGGMQRYE